MKYLIIVFLFSSCSLIEKRKSHFNYLDKGTSKQVVLEKSGEPDSRHFSNDVELLQYEYCEAPYWKEAIFGLLTFGIYATSCNMSMVKMGLYFKDDVLVGMNGDMNYNERMSKRQAFGRAMSDAARENSQRQNNQPVYQLKGRKTYKSNCRKQFDGSTTCETTEN